MGIPLHIPLSISIVQLAVAVLAGRGPVNDGTVKILPVQDSFAWMKWADDPFDVPAGTDSRFAQLQVVLSNQPRPNEQVNDPDDELADVRPKRFQETVLMDYGGRRDGRLTIFPGPIKFRVRWSPEVIAAGALYAILKIQNVHHGRPEPSDINRIRRLLYRIDDPEFVMRRRIRSTAEYKWVLQRAWAFVDAMLLYRQSSKYFWLSRIEEYAEHREIVRSLSAFLSRQDASDRATETLQSVRQKRQPMHPIHALQIMKRRLVQALLHPLYRESLDVYAVECSISSPQGKTKEANDDEDRMDVGRVIQEALMEATGLADPDANDPNRPVDFSLHISCKPVDIDPP